mmetsp:Transcript_130640/g.406205  ORF Transcript_130640/g.406205 Transcript_130640/m.406205 type:complete len:410 (+) Transcript_130640:877-2106(+)
MLPALLHHGLLDLRLADGVHHAQEGGAGVGARGALLPEAHVRVLHQLHPVALLLHHPHDVALHHDANGHVCGRGPPTHDHLIVLHDPGLPVARNQADSDARLRRRVLPREDGLGVLHEDVGALLVAADGVHGLQLPVDLPAGREKQPLLAADVGPRPHPRGAADRDDVALLELRVHGGGVVPQGVGAGALLHDPVVHLGHGLERSRLCLRLQVHRWRLGLLLGSCLEQLQRVLRRRNAVLVRVVGHEPQEVPVVVVPDKHEAHQAGEVALQQELRLGGLDPRPDLGVLAALDPLAVLRAGIRPVGAGQGREAETGAPPHDADLVGGGRGLRAQEDEVVDDLPMLPRAHAQVRVERLCGCLDPVGHRLRGLLPFGRSCLLRLGHGKLLDRGLHGGRGRFRVRPSGERQEL